MNLTTAVNSTEALNSYEIGTFVPTPKQIEIAADAIEIANQMRVDGDTDVENFARAMIIIRGAAFHHRFEEINYIPDPIEEDRQVSAYLVGVALLMTRHPDPHVANRTGGLIVVGGIYELKN